LWFGEGEPPAPLCNLVLVDYKVSLPPTKGYIVAKFVDPADFDGDVPGRGRKPSDVALECSKALAGCPVGKAAILEGSNFTATAVKDRARIRSAITTGARLAGWEKASVQWTVRNLPLVTRVA